MVNKDYQCIVHLQKFISRTLTCTVLGLSRLTAILLKPDL